MAVTKTTDIADALRVQAIRKALAYAMPKLVFPLFGQHDEIAEREGKAIQWFRFSKLALPESALAESPTWAPETLANTKVNATLELWGNGVEYTEFLQKTTYLDDFPNSVKKLVGQNAGESINEQVANTLKAGTQVIFPNGKTESTFNSDDVITLNTILDAVAELEENDAPRITETGLIDKTQIDGDMPVDGVYIAFISPRVKSQLMKETAFREAVRYQKQSMFSGHLCTIDGVAFLVTSTAPTRTSVGSNSSVGTADQTIIVGAGAYGVPSLTRDMFDIVVTPPGGHGDEFAVKTAVAWKAYYKAVILNQDWIIRIESARSSA